jgi:DnaD/phage-associated family protein
MADTLHPEEFQGFPAGRLSYTSLPDLFFSELLPAIDDLFELKVFLHCFWRIQKQRGALRYVTRKTLAAEAGLQRSLARDGHSFERELERALSQAVGRGTLLAISVAHDGVPETCYFLNTEEGRRTVARVHRGETQLTAVAMPEGGAPSPTRPNIFVLYEQTIGLLQPMIADELRDAEETYPAEWIEEAFRIAAERNVRNWRYVRAILQRWAAQGKDDGKSGKDRRRYIRGPYADYIEH